MYDSLISQVAPSCYNMASSLSYLVSKIEQLLNLSLILSAMDTDGGSSSETVQVRNKKVMLKHHINGFPKESDLHVTTETVVLKVLQGSNTVPVKVLYLSIEPYQYIRSRKIENPGVFSSYPPGSVSNAILFNYIFYEMKRNLRILVQEFPA
jgi:hypothetical protein